MKRRALWRHLGIRSVISISTTRESRALATQRSAPLPAIGSPAKARILVVEDNPFFREGISRLINRQPDLCCCGESDSVALIPAIATREKPDLILLDVNLKDGESLQLIQPLLRSLPMTAILILSTSDEVHAAETALCAGALGYVVKHDSVAEILGAIRDVLRRKVFVSSALATRLAYKLIRS